MKNWKTTVEGVLSFLITTLTVIAGFQVPAALQPQNNKVALYIQAGVILALALCNAWIRLIQNDGKSVAQVQQIAADVLAAQQPPQQEARSLGAAAASTKLGVWALIALILPLSLMGATGCSGTQVAQDIVNWTPALEAAVTTIDSTAALLDPGAAPIFVAATVGFDAASTLLVNGAKAYLANPTAPLLAQLQTQVVTFQQEVNAAVLKAAKIVDPNSQTHALNVIQAVAAIVTTMLALITSISSKTSVARMAANSPIKLAMLPRRPENYTQTVSILATHYAEPIPDAQMEVDLGTAALTYAGF
jgi:hypothetical protein